MERYTVAGDAGTQHLWQTIWLIPAVMAFAVMLLFAFVFRDPARESAAAYQQKVEVTG